MFQIEEEIEEITEYVSDKEEGEESSSNPTTTRTLTKTGPWLSEDPAMQSVECILAELNTELQRESLPVPFPEFGVDIILHHNKDFSDEEESATSSSEGESEEESLCKQKSQVSKKAHFNIVCERSQRS